MLLNNIQFVETQAPAFDTLSRAPSSTFEKVGRWMFSGDEVDSSGLPEAVCCPCVAYGRTRLRFNEAVDRSYGIYETKEQHQQSPIYPVVTKDCCVFASLCLPLYGGFISDLRGDVRRLYNIEGNEHRDCLAGCCDPCYTLIHVENEIIGRERGRKHSDASGYTSHPPMCSSSSGSVRIPSKSSSPSTERDDCLPCIPEDHSVRSPSTPISRRSSKNRERSIAVDPVAPTDATLVHNHDISNDPKGPTSHLHGNHSLSKDAAPTYATHDHDHDIGQDPKGPAFHIHGSHRLSKDTTTPSYPPSIHQLRTDTKAPASPPAVHRHDLFHDAAETAPPQRSNHDIGSDPVDTYRASPEHTIHQDETAPRNHPASSHALGHDLVSNQAGTYQPHTLGADDEVTSKIESLGAHHLYEDK
ncbi:uncharacterized protein FIESC28_02000 [Fusarium coffeatum]|uniref:Uncharacterized protein n=1 Tax=Fusarium coffeatum TaxID=231269 RepID=A0A366S7Y1_9HYPO|nr:uncharacterized protein FIESC28_02000 [Fusarium coffeatum]RBR25092.1 hypothetical protein FIESC28_02000 [Fusarium coffeatum]